ncbi:MBL fold metallo-hydrolase [Candidatus Gracilibacteria bacterium]|nr:MBL fold metallo-hydrolase [Candidatus Gracilibacteria bacterium]MCF7856486.1 MBL fold metallo-hydrolase [Candidatus Gracilibacteria bacterium]MCF7896782.1 MBL fold metallo-hydrolase [Candidatus Gracilibacteria bacterium]
MLINKVQTGSLAENCWILRDKKNAAIIDPGDNAEKILKELDDAKVLWILLTHSHIDHLGALAKVWKKTGGRIAVHSAETEIVERGEPNPPNYPMRFEPVLVTKKLEDGDILDFENLKIEVIHTPGHTPGSCCFRIGDELFSGDTLFKENVGRWDLAGGDLEDLRHSLTKILKLPDELKIHPGHDADWTMSEARNFHFPI